MNKLFNVVLASHWCDMTALLEDLPAESSDEAKDRALSFMARPESWHILSTREVSDE